MVNKSDFSLKLLSSLTAYAATEGEDVVVSTQESAGLFMKAALALRAWYRHAALIERPEMVVQETGTRFEVYGGTFIERQADGTLKMENQGRPENGIYVEVASLGQWLARNARQQVQLHYLAKAQDLVRSQALDAKGTRQLISALEKANDYVSFKLNVCWWRRKSSLAADGRVLGKLLWDSEVLDRQVFSLAVRVAGFKFTVPAFNTCAAHREALAARIKEAPHMAPWLLESSYNADTLHVQETVWKDLKDKFMAEGGTPQAWKWLSNQGYNWFRFFRLDKRHIKVLNQLATLQLGKAPMHLGFMGSLRSILAYDHIQGSERYLDVFKVAVVAFKKRKLKMADFSDYNLIFDYLKRVPTAATKGATWGSLMRKQHVWHMEFAREEMERRREAGGCLGWVPFAQSLVEGDLEAVSLNNSDELWEEGSAMSHCVGGYDEQCYRNISRIYSIRRGDERVATLEIRRYDGELTIGQLYAFGNRKVKDVSVTKFAKKVLSTCKRTPEPDLSANTVIRQPKDKPRKWARPVEHQPADQQAAPQFANTAENVEEIPF
jgi:hypothetical protein